MLSLLNILCTRQAKQCDTKNNDSQFTLIHQVTAIPILQLIGYRQNAE